jgi:serine/threonine protein kinase
MSSSSDHRSLRIRGWQLTVKTGKWNPELQARVLTLAEQQAPAKHPAVHCLAAEGVYVKIFRPPLGFASFKDVFRASKAERFFRQSSALARAGFSAPETIAFGEARRCFLVRVAFVAMLSVDGEALPAYLGRRQKGSSQSLTLKQKISACRQLAQTIRRFHDRGFVHGDLVPSNLFIGQNGGAGFVFYFMDNDRTRRYPEWLPQRLWRRNLIQLNRFPLPGISLHDRMRFFKAYTGEGRRRARDDRLLRWLEARTRQRRKECDAADPTIDFRRLMRWEETPPKQT